VQLSENLNAPVFTKRTAETFVTVKNGETVVIGGLIRNERGTTQTKVPILGDIPILGLFFKSQVNTSIRTELLIIITPRIVRTIEDAHRISVQERDVGGIIPYETKRNPLFQGLQVVTPPAPGAPVPAGMELAPTSPRETYGPPPVRYGPQAPSANEDETAPEPVAADSLPNVEASQSRADHMDYLELRR
jgi:hypothetical protein